MKRSILHLLSIALLSFFPVVGLAEVGRSEAVVQQQDTSIDRVDTLIKILEADRNFDKSQAARRELRSIVELNPTIVNLLIQRIQSSKQSEIRYSSIFALEHMGKPAKSAIPVLVTLLKDQDPQVRSSAFYAWRQLEDFMAATPLLIEMLKDPNRDVRFRAVWALKSFWQFDSSRELQTSLRLNLTPLLREKDWTIRLNVIMIFEESQYVAAEFSSPVIPQIIILLQDSEAPIRASAASTLGALGPVAKEATQYFIALLHDSDSWVRRKTAKALGSMGESAKPSIPSRIPLLKDQDEGVRSSAAEALNKLGYKP